MYGKVLSAEDAALPLDGSDSYEVSAQYDLGGGAALMGGVRRTYNLTNNVTGGEEDAIWIGDFGISMAF